MSIRVSAQPSVHAPAACATRAGSRWLAATLLACAVLLGGCAATVDCPQVDGPTRAALLLDHGRHASLAIENAHGVLHRYSYGDRRWYALGDTGIAAGLDALLRDTPAVLIRYELHAAPSLDAVQAALGLVVENLYSFAVRAQHADALIARLDSIYFSDPDARSRRFASHPQPYTVWHNSNHMAAEWLHELGCNVSGNPVISNWR